MAAAKYVPAPLKRLKARLANAIDNLSIRAKLFLYAALLIVLMLLLASFTWYQVSEIQNQRIPARAAARDMEAALLDMRIQELSFTNEADSLNIEFYLKQKSTKVDAWQESYRTFEQNYTTLTELFDRGEVIKELEAAQPLVVKYRDTFLSMTGAYRERGFQSFGREGLLRQRAEWLQASVSGSPSVEVTFLKLQEMQNRFLLYQDMSVVATFREYAAQLRAQLTKAEDRTVFDEYTRVFDEVVAIHQKIGLTDAEGLRGELNKLTAAITPHIQSVESLVLESTSASINSIAHSIYLTTAILTAIAVVLAYLLARLILRKIVLLSEASKHVAAGNLHYRLPLSSTDELGQLSQSFNSMTQQLQEGQRKLRVRAHELGISVKRFELVSRAVNEAIYEWDIAKGTMTWGDGLGTVFGYRPENQQTPIEWWVEHIHPEDAQAIDTSLSEHLRRHSSNWKKEYRLKRTNGSYAYCQDRGFIEYEGDQPVRMVGSIIDITRQKELEHAKNEFISIASHQLRTPLGSIRWNLELLLERIHVMSKEDGGLVQEAYDSTRRMGNLVNDLLSVARIEQGRVQDIPQETDLVQVLHAAIKEIQPLAKRRHVHINSSSLDHKKAELIIDPKRFREVLQNLLSNAVKYTPSKGKVTVAIQAKSEAFIVTVADTGIGIPLEEQHKMFSKFYRAQNVLTTDTEGSGLGLFVVKSYVEAWGGRVWFTSELNKGTTFYVSIPRKPRRKKNKA